MQTSITHRIATDSADHNTTAHNQERGEEGGTSATPLTTLTGDSTMSMRSPQQRATPHSRMPLVGAVNAYYFSRGINPQGPSYNEQTLQDLTNTSTLLTEADKQEIITLIQFNLTINTRHGHRPERYQALSEHLYDNHYFNTPSDLVLLMHTLSFGSITTDPAERHQTPNGSQLHRLSSQQSPDQPIATNIQEILLSKGATRLHALVGYYAFLAQREPQMDSPTKALHTALFLVRAQPFSDGNHRTATRILINCSAIIAPEKREVAETALAETDISYGPLTKLYDLLNLFNHLKCSDTGIEYLLEDFKSPKARAQHYPKIFERINHFLEAHY